MFDMVEGFVRWTEGAPAPELWRKWTGVFLVSAGLSRRTYTVMRQGTKQTFPNLYLLLVGSPASGKTTAIEKGRQLIRPDEGAPVIDPDHLTPDKLTARRLTAIMSYADKPDAKVDIHVPRQSIMTKKVAFISEWRDFLPPLEEGMMALLSNLWDCPAEYQYETQHHGQDSVYNSYLTVLGGVQPWWFGRLPQSAFEQGFMTRLLLVHCDEQVEQPLFGNANEADRSQRMALLQSRFQSLCCLEGAFEWYPKAQNYLEEWYRDGCKPKPDHPLLRDYAGRRELMAVKLIMLAGASRTGKLVVTQEDVERGLSWLFEAEATAPHALRDANTIHYHGIERSAMTELLREHKRSRKPMTEETLRRALARSVAPNVVGSVIDGLVGQGRLIPIGQSKAPRRRFMPGFTSYE